MMIETFAVIPGFSFRSGITDADDRVVSHNVLNRDRRISHLHNFAVKGAASEKRRRVKSTSDRPSTAPTSASATLASICIFVRSLAIVKIIGACKTGGDGLPNIDAARNHLSIYRRRDRAMVEIGFRFIERALFDFHIRFRLMQICHRLIEVGLRRIFFREQFLGPRRIKFRQFKRCLGIGQIALSLRHRRLKQDRIDLCDNIARFHLGIKIDKSF